MSMTTEHSRFEFSLDGIAHQLQDRLLAVPIYQRSYSWKDDQIIEYWADLRTAFSDPNPEYFLGTVVLTRQGQNGRDTIIDGQQRLATTAILLAAIRDEYRTRLDQKRAEIIQSGYISAPDLESGAEKPRLQMNSEDDSYFRRVIVGAEDPVNVPRLHPSHELIKNALATFRKQISAVADDAGSDWAKRLFTWVNFLTKQVRIVVVEVPTESDAFLIFETLNDRGADLTIADLLKNYLFGRAGSRLNTVRDGWLLTLGHLDITAENQMFTTFLRHYWSSRYGLVRERDLYKSIRERVTNETQAVEFVENLQSASRLYAALRNSDHEVWASYGTGTKENIDSLLRLDLEQDRPLILAALQHFSEKEVRILLRTLVDWSVRRLFIGGLGGGTPEKAYCAAAVKVRNGEIKTVPDLLKELDSIIPSDAEFRTAFSIAKVPKPNLARYYLLALERGMAGSDEPELVPNKNEEEVNLEHILPRNPADADWPQFSKDERKEWVHRLGNLALLSKGPNGRIGNKPFSVKEPILSASQLMLTRETGTVLDWTPTAIEERQIRLAEVALKVWPRLR